MNETPITKGDITEKFREVLGEGNPAAALTKGGSRVATGLGILLTISIAIYLLGRRRGMKKKTIVEIKRI